ncbi:hypothetical protein I4U23_023091 [Adineta vaga]|nr:hypothetical protein I4U23_023091 [Adineta vaga]
MQCLHCSKQVCIDCAQKHVELSNQQIEAAKQVLANKINVLDRLVVAAKERVKIEREKIIQQADTERDRAFIQIDELYEQQKKQLQDKSTEMHQLGLDKISSYIQRMTNEIEDLNEDNQQLFCVIGTPVELIFYIFRYLDAPTIVRSVRRVCKQFYTIVPTYDRFQLNFKSILKSDFHLLCNLVESRNVEVLTLSDDDETPGQIEYFISTFCIDQFIRLRKLTLYEIDNCYLHIILTNIKTSELNSLSIYSKRDYSQDNTTAVDLASAIVLPRLLTFHLNIPSFDVTNIAWPFQCTIKHLEICCHSFDGYCNFLYHLPNLQTLVVEQLHVNDLEQIKAKLTEFEPVNQLTSLTLKYSLIDMAILELLLSLTPLLKHLGLVRAVSLHAFISHLSEWEKFIGTRMLLLKKFEFFLIDDQNHILPELDPESYIASFRTPFWTEMKKWFITCDCITDSNSSTILLYSSSFFDPQFEYVLMNGVRKMRLNIVEVMSQVTSSQNGFPNNVLFPQLDELKLCISDKWPLVPDYVRHVVLSVSTVDHMHMVLRQLKHRPTIRFEYPNPIT